MPPWWVPVALLAITFLGEVRTWRDFAARAAPSAQDRGSLRVNNVLGWVALAAGTATALALRGRPAFAPPAWLAWARSAVPPSEVPKLAHSLARKSPVRRRATSAALRPAAQLNW